MLGTWMNDLLRLIVSLLLLFHLRGQVFMLSDTALLEKSLVMEVLGRGHSRVPVYR